MRPGKITPKRFVPDNVVKPDWADTGIPTEEQKSKSAKIIEVYSPEEIEIMREVCLLGKFYWMEVWILVILTLC